jgi:hypothetical protein
LAALLQTSKSVPVVLFNGAKITDTAFSFAESVVYSLPQCLNFPERLKQH